MRCSKIAAEGWSAYCVSVMLPTYKPKPQKLFAVPAGFALAGAVAADGGIRYAGGGGKRFGGTAECFDI